MDTLAVLVQWATDHGLKKMLWEGDREDGTYVPADEVDLDAHVAAMTEAIKTQGIVPLYVARVHTQRIPLVGTVPSRALAAPVQYVAGARTRFHVQQEMLG